MDQVTKVPNKVIKIRGMPTQVLLLTSFSYSLGANGTKIILVTLVILFGTLIPKVTKSLITLL